MVDLKALDPEVHRATDRLRDNERVLDSIRYLHEQRQAARGAPAAGPGLQRHHASSWSAPRAGYAGLDPDLRIIVIGFRQHGVRAAWADTPQAGPELLDQARRALEDAGMTEVVTV